MFLVVFPHQSNPENNIFINKAVEVLVEEEEAGADEGCVIKIKLAPGHVSNLEKSKSVKRVSSNYSQKRKQIVSIFRKSTLFFFFSDY